MSSDVRGAWPPFPLPKTTMQNLEVGIVEVLRVAAVDTALITGHTFGDTELASGVPNAAPLNGHGEPGHDHSGGEWGRPFYRSLATMCLDNFNTYDSAGFESGPAPFAHGHENAAGGDTTSIPGSWEVPIWVPPCDPENGAYRELGIHLTFNVSVTSLVAADKIIWRFKQETPGMRTPRGTTIRASLQGTGYNSTGQYTLSSSGAASRILMLPGAMNVLSLQSDIVRDSGGSSRAATFQLIDLEFGVYET